MSIASLSGIISNWTEFGKKSTFTKICRMNSATTLKDVCLEESKYAILTRSEKRIKQLGEVFTPTELVLEILDQLPDHVWEAGKTYLDPTCGNGQFLAAVLIIKMALGHTNPLATIYGVDIMQDNVDECRQRLIDIAGDTPENWDIVKNNIRCEDGLKYDYSFDPNPPPTESLFDWS